MKIQKQVKIINKEQLQVYEKNIHYVALEGNILKER